MAASIFPEYPPELSPEQDKYLLSSLNDWSMANGLAVRPSSAFVSQDIDPSGVLAVTAPVTLFPSLFSRACFEEARLIQKAYNQLYAAIARDEEWLGEIMQELIEVDDFISQLWDVHLHVKKEGYVQKLTLGLFRSDYMIHTIPSSPSQPTIKQVEFNTIASSFGGLSSQVTLLHKHLLATTAYPPHPSLTPTALPPNLASASLAHGLTTAHHAYGPSKSSPTLPLCVLFVVQPQERNIFDQLHLSQHLSTNLIPTFRLPFPDILTQTSIPSSNPSRPLIYHPPHSPHAPYEVTTLYFRAGYAPSEYTSPTSWPARLHIERSAAIKCPSILTHLAGSKKVQQVLATPSSPTLLRFLPSSAASAVRRTFAAIYPLDSSAAGQAAKAIALDEAKCRGYVLKPQREGGGNNVYGAKIPGFLRALGDERKWRAYVLMELIETPAARNTVVREGEVRRGEVVGELGVYGACLWRGGREGGEGGMGWIVLNEEAGYLLRTKGRESEEGGVAAGYGAVDSVCLVDV